MQKMYFSRLKGLSHDMDVAFVTCLVSCRPQKETGPFLKIISVVYLVQVSLFIGQHYKANVNSQSMGPVDTSKTKS